MKILFFIESLRTGGKERRMSELIKQLCKDNKFNIELVLTVKQIDFKEINNLNIKIHIIERKLGKKDPSLFYSFYKIAKQFKPDVIHVWGNMVAFYAIPSKLFLRIPLINNQITDANENLTKGFLSHKIPFLFSNLIIANSRAGLFAYKSPELKSKVIYNGFNFKRIKNLALEQEIKEELAIHTKYVIGMVANFEERKDYATYISAGLELLKTRKDITFLSVGDGPNRQVIEAMITNELKPYFLFLGRRNDVEKIVSIFDIGVLVSNTKKHSEGISNALIEIMAQAVPVIATNSGGTPELVEDKFSGFLVNSFATNELVEKLKELLENDLLRREIGNNARDSIIKNFSMEKMVESFTTVYESFQTKRT